MLAYQRLLYKSFIYLPRFLYTRTVSVYPRIDIARIRSSRGQLSGILSQATRRRLHVYKQNVPSLNYNNLSRHLLTC